MRTPVTSPYADLLTDPDLFRPALNTCEGLTIEQLRAD